MSRTGTLRHKVDIERRVEASDSGYLHQEWETRISLMAAIEPGKGGEIIREGLVHTTRATKITTRYHPDVAREDRIRWLDPRTNTERYYRIETIEDWQEKARWLFMHCTELDGKELVA